MKALQGIKRLAAIGVLGLFVAGMSTSCKSSQNCPAYSNHKKNKKSQYAQVNVNFEERA